MIELQNIEINEITLGTIPIVEITLGDIPVWPSGYTYTLTFKQVNYSSGSSIKANQTNYATFICYYDKFNSSNVLVLRQEVTATPSATAFKTYDTSLYFDYDEYKGTQVISGTKTATLYYNGLSTTGDFTFQGNYASYSISPIVLDSSLVDASGGVVNYTGGEVTTSWTSGYTNPTTQKATFSTYGGCSNSQVNTVIGYIISYTSQITIQSLARNATSGQSYYTFTSDSYGGQTVSVTVYQKQNAMYTTPAAQSYFFYNSDNDTLYDSSIYVPAVPGASSTFRFKIKYDPLVWYDADPTKIGTGGRTLKAADYTVNVAVAEGGGCVTSVNIVGIQSTSEIYEVNYSPNPSTTTDRSSILVAIANDYSWNTSIQVWQPHQ